MLPPSIAEILMLMIIIIMVIVAPAAVAQCLVRAFVCLEAA